MMSPTSASKRRAGGRRAGRAGFTLTELLVVVGIIAVLVGILFPVVNRAMRNAQRARTAADLQAIAVGLDTYKQDHGSYPRVDLNASPFIGGAQVLCRALVAPLPANAGSGPSDGADGNGFRIRGTQGRVYGPYIDLSKFRVDNDENPGTALVAANAVIRDRYNRPILYFAAATQKPNISANNGFASSVDGALYDFRQDRGNFGGLGTIRKFQAMLGDIDGNGAINGDEAPATTGPYILWSAGEDGIFGPTANPISRQDVTKCDDVTNFSFQ
jgi:prepilin-type N-terminal cleavage/methylation domain-containing protein